MKLQERRTKKVFLKEYAEQFVKLSKQYAELLAIVERLPEDHYQLAEHASALIELEEQIEKKKQEFNQIQFN